DTRIFSPLLYRLSYLGKTRRPAFIREPMAFVQRRHAAEMRLSIGPGLASRGHAMNGRIMIYGATGYTGKLVAKEAKRQGLNPLLAGRSAAKLKAVAGPLGFEYRAFGLDNIAAMDAALSEVQAVLHIAGPFSKTSKPMLDACLRTKRHYLDITGEIDVLEKMSRGTAKSSMESVGNPVRVRRDGKIVTQWPPDRRSFDFGRGPRP